MESHKLGRTEQFRPWWNRGWNHGITGYKKYKCKCDVCMAAGREAAKKYRTPRSPKHDNTIDTILEILHG